MASIQVELPALGESVVEGTVSRWLVKEGDRVERDQPLVEITTDKVDAEIPAPEAGVVEKILVPEGETVAVGTALATLSAGGSAARSGPQARGVPGAADAEAAKAPGRAPARAAAAVEETPGIGAPLATPLARRVAEREGVALREVEPSGP
jgi:pyruvate/2-oxoglutarate dehydrogenase complex dihydrolipoamide acyltransferase (E2) component